MSLDCKFARRTVRSTRPFLHAFLHDVFCFCSRISFRWYFFINFVSVVALEKAILRKEIWEGVLIVYVVTSFRGHHIPRKSCHSASH